MTELILMTWLLMSPPLDEFGGPYPQFVDAFQTYEACEAAATKLWANNIAAWCELKDPSS